MWGMTIGAAWTLFLLLWLPAAFAGAHELSPSTALAVTGGLLSVLVASMVVTVGMRRFLSEEFADGEPFPTGHPGQIGSRVLTNTTEQAVLAFLVWPAVALFIGVPVLASLAVGFVVARVLFWVGYHYWPWLRATAYAMTLYPTAGAVIWLGTSQI